MKGETEAQAAARAKRMEKQARRYVDSLSDREKMRFKQREKRDALHRAGAMVWDDWTGRTYFNRGIDDPKIKTYGNQYKEHRNGKMARIND